MHVRRASVDELPSIMTVLDGGLLAIAADRVRSAVAAGDVLVAVESDRVLGAMVIELAARSNGARIEAIAVRRGRRGQGIGTALVRAAAVRHGSLIATFDDRVRPFWTSLGFEVDSRLGPGRFEGSLNRSDES